MPTNPDELDSNDIRYRFASQINSQQVDGGGVWKNYIPDVENRVLYDFNIFVLHTFQICV